MIFKVFFVAENRKAVAPSHIHLCKVLAVENGPQLESRINNIIANLKADGYDFAEVEDCWSISEPSIIGPR